MAAKTKVGMCARNCNRMLTSKEVKSCTNCLHENTYDKLRCNSCGTLVTTWEVNLSKLDQLCYKCNSDQGYPATTNKFYKGSKSGSVGSGVGYTHMTMPDTCTHKGSPHVLTLGKGKVFAGGSKTVQDWTCLPETDLILRLTGKADRAVSWNAEAVELLGEVMLNGLTSAKPYIFVDWSDMQAPPVGLKFVEQVVGIVESGKNILVHCVGGHGRTGTMLMALAHVGGVVPLEHQKDPIKWLRSIYCQDAVESKTQEDWLRSLGVKILM